MGLRASYGVELKIVCALSIAYFVSGSSSSLMSNRCDISEYLLKQFKIRKKGNSFRPATFCHFVSSIFCSFDWRCVTFMAVVEHSAMYLNI